MQLQINGTNKKTSREQQAALQALLEWNRVNQDMMLNKNDINTFRRN